MRIAYCTGRNTACATQARVQIRQGTSSLEVNEKRFRKETGTTHPSYPQTNRRETNLFECATRARRVLWRRADRQVRLERRRIELPCEDANDFAKQFALRLSRDEPIRDCSPFFQCAFSSADFRSFIEAVARDTAPPRNGCTKRIRPN